MLIFVEGESDYLAKRTIAQIKSKYLSKNSDAELFEADPDLAITNWADLLAVPLFASSRLAVVTRAGLFSAELQDGLARTLQVLPETTVVVLWDKKKLGKTLQVVATAAEKKIPATHPTDRELLALLRTRTKELGSDPLETSVYAQLIAQNGTDLWALETALFSLLSGGVSDTGPSKSNQVEDQFGLFRMIDQGKWSQAAERIVQEYKAGKPIEMVIGAIASALRRSKISVSVRLHLVELMADIDLGLKTGLIEEEDAVALLCCYLPDPTVKRLQWEKVWEEIYT